MTTFEYLRQERTRALTVCAGLLEAVQPIYGLITRYTGAYGDGKREDGAGGDGPSGGVCGFGGGGGGFGDGVNDDGDGVQEYEGKWSRTMKFSTTSSPSATCRQLLFLYAWGLILSQSLILHDHQTNV